VSLSASLDADNYEVTGPIGDTVTLDAIVGGRFNRARARLFQVNWKDLSQGAIKLLAGNVSEARVEGGKFTLEVRSDMDRYNQVVGRVLTDSCDADFADQVSCFATATEITGTVTDVTDAMRFTVSFTGSYANDFFNKGTVRDFSGASGGRPVEIESWTSAGVIVLFAPLTEAPRSRRHNDRSQRLREVSGQLHDVRANPQLQGLSRGSGAQSVHSSGAGAVTKKIGDRVVAEARKWIGTPFHDHARSKASGATARGWFGALPRFEAQGGEYALRAVHPLRPEAPGRGSFQPVERGNSRRCSIRVDEIKPGDILLCLWGGQPGSYRDLRRMKGSQWSALPGSGVKEPQR
jgi:hypothetical protein